MSEQPQDKLTSHNYDGIQEYDNPTPSWWVYLFWLSVLFAPVYMVFTLMAQGQLSPIGQYERAVVANLQKKFGEIGELEANAETILRYSEDEEWRAFGQNVFQSHCISCHGSNAAGSESAPNLTDEQYIHIQSVEDIATIIRNGANNQAMPAWENRLHPNEVVLVSAYVASLRGTNVAGAPPEGTEIPPWSAE